MTPEQVNAVNDAVVGRIEFSPKTELERREEIDNRVGALMAKREAERSLYVRGFFDCFYVLIFVALGVYIYWMAGQEE